MHAHRYGSINVYCKGSSRASWRNLSAISCSCQTRAPRTSRIGFFNAPSTSAAGSSSGSATFNAILAPQCQSQCKYIIFYQWLLANHGTMTSHFISRGIQSNNNHNNNNNKFYSTNTTHIPHKNLFWHFTWVLEQTTINPSTEVFKPLLLLHFYCCIKVIDEDKEKRCQFTFLGMVQVLVHLSVKSFNENPKCH